MRQAAPRAVHLAGEEGLCGDDRHMRLQLVQRQKIIKRMRALEAWTERCWRASRGKGLRWKYESATEDCR